MIRAANQLDFSAHSVFVKAAALADTPEINQIVVDFSKTRTLRDSGLGLLIMLYEAGARLKYKLKLLNCSPSIKKRLSSSGYQSCFAIS